MEKHRETVSITGRGYTWLRWRQPLWRESGHYSYRSTAWARVSWCSKLQILQHFRCMH